VKLPFGERLTDWGYAAGWRVVREMPEPWARGIAGAGARYAARGGGPEQLRKNLARVIGSTPAEVPDSLIRAALASYARYWREAFRLPSMDLPALADRLDKVFVGAEYFAAAHAAGRGAVMALPHSGNWDMAGVWLAQNYGTFATVAERLKPESLYDRFIEFREGLGFEVLPLTGGLRERLTHSARARTAVFIQAVTDVQPLPGEVLVKLYGLTPAETRMLGLVGQGLTVKEAAESLGITMPTARTHMRNLFDKTGARRQAELVRLTLSALPFPASGRPPAPS
jgi:KDO2-lipid IV(A) lauroyltransferase